MTVMWRTNDIVVKWGQFSVNELELLQVALEESLPTSGPVLQVGEVLQKRRMVEELKAVLVLRGLQESQRDD